MTQPEEAKIGGLSEPGEYDESMLALLQIIWGDGFLSPGGSEEIARLLEGSSIAGCKVLDIGCGLGAIDELLVHEHGASSVVGVDIDPQLVERMRARMARAGLSDRIDNVCDGLAGGASVHWGVAVSESSPRSGDPSRPLSSAIAASGKNQGMYR